MITQENLVEIHVLYRQGYGIRAIARKLGMIHGITTRHSPKLVSSVQN